jgi:hypothetical protein
VKKKSKTNENSRGEKKETIKKSVKGVHLSIYGHRWICISSPFIADEKRQQ